LEAAGSGQPFAGKGRAEQTKGGEKPFSGKEGLFSDDKRDSVFKRHKLLYRLRFCFFIGRGPDNQGEYPVGFLGYEQQD
jgi:hypothetical protein